MGFSTVSQLPYNTYWQISTIPVPDSKVIQLILSPQEERSPIEHIRLFIDIQTANAEVVIYSKPHLDSYIRDSIPKELCDHPTGPLTVEAYPGKIFLGSEIFHLVIIRLNINRYRFHDWLHKISPIDDKILKLLLSLEAFIISQDKDTFLANLNEASLNMFAATLPLTLAEHIEQAKSGELVQVSIGTEISKQIYSPSDLYNCIDSELSHAIYAKDISHVLSVIEGTENRIQQKIKKFEHNYRSSDKRESLNTTIRELEIFKWYEFGNFSPLLVAIITNQPMIVSRLLRLGVRNQYGENLYGNAICNKVDPEIIHLLLSYQIKFNSNDNILIFLMTNLHHKIFYDYFEWFLVYQFQTKMQGGYGLKPLQQALINPTLQNEPDLKHIRTLLLYTHRFIPEGHYSLPEMICDLFKQHNQQLVRHFMPNVNVPKLRTMTSNGSVFTCELSLNDAIIHVELKILSSLNQHELDECWSLFSEPFAMRQDDTEANRQNYFNDSFQSDASHLKYAVLYKRGNKIVGFITFSLEPVALNKVNYLEIIFHLAHIDKKFNNQKLGSFGFFYVLLIEKLSNNLLPIYFVAKMIPPGFGYGMQPIIRYPKYQGDFAYQFSLVELLCRKMHETLKENGRLTPKLKVIGYSKIEGNSKLSEFNKLAGQDALGTIFRVDRKAQVKLMNKIGIFGITQEHVEMGSQHLLDLQKGRIGSFF